MGQDNLYSPAQNRRGFTLVELGMLLTITTLVALIMIPALQSTRSQMRGTKSTTNLLEIGQGAGMYANANKGRLFSYSWRAGQSYKLPNGTTRFGFTDIDAAGLQMQEILMRRTGRIDPGPAVIQTFNNRLPHRRFNHLVLADFMNSPLESTLFIDPADDKQLNWYANPLEYLQAENTLPYANGSDFTGYDEDRDWDSRYVVQKWTFASSYHCVPDSWQPDGRSGRYIPTANTPHFFSPFGGGNIQLYAGRNYSEVVQPSQKVWMFEEFDREQQPIPYFGYDHARTAKLMFDGSVNEWASGDANAAVVPELGYGAWKQIYVPLHRFPVPLEGFGNNVRELHQRFRWTFRGLAGVDYGNADAPRGVRVKRLRASGR